MENTRKNVVLDPKTYDFVEPDFSRLMQKRIHKVLIICSNYDYYMLEEDGRIDEQIFNEYVSLNLRYPPVFIQANSASKALRILHNEDIDLIISMLNVGHTDAFELSKQIKALYSKIPIVVLTHFSREVTIKLAHEDLSAIDHVFCWLGNADILLAIIKLIEDEMNFEYDVRESGVQTVILVENSIRFYSSYLPTLYKMILKQAQRFMTEGLNEHQAMIRMRSRPKIMLATTYEQAVDIYEENKQNILGIISDISYKRHGKRDKEAGIQLARHVRASNPHLPILLQSADDDKLNLAPELNVGAVSKTSPTLLIELRNFVNRNFGFDDFIFLNPDTLTEVGRATNVREMQEKIFTIPDNSFNYHIKRHDFSRWLKARGLFSIAQLFADVSSRDFDHDLTRIRQFIHDAIGRYRQEKSRGVIAKFDADHYDEYLPFSRIGNGYLGGKGRGLAFIDSFLKRINTEISGHYGNVQIVIPRTVVLTTEIFDEFMDTNDLYHIGLSNITDQEILDNFVAAHFPEHVRNDLRAFLRVCKNPVAVRSSSVLEDSHYQPFAGIYSTYMVPPAPNDIERSLDMIITAVKSVYASVYFHESKTYMAVTHNVIDEERMAIIVQEVAGIRYGNRYYPHISGVARSLNFYPIAPERPEDGIANIALGLGKIIVDGGLSLRFSPKYPQKIIQLSSPEIAMRDTQKHFYALDLSPDSFQASLNEGVNLVKLRVTDAEKDGAAKHCLSTFDSANNMIRDGLLPEGRRVVTFANVLKYKTFPISEIVQYLLELGQTEMNNAVEIEFAATMSQSKDEPHKFHFLQIRPIVENHEQITFKLDKISDDRTIINCYSALGNGIIREVCDVVYVRPESFQAGDNPKLVDVLDQINSRFLKENKTYILIGPGRWGSSDPWLGIPVKWSQISAARVIVEAGLKNYRIDPSQGTHFFQNLTSFRVAYFTINPYINDGFYDVHYLNALPAEYEDEHIRHVKFVNALEIKIDGKNNRGVIFKPE